jgi:hypothetical protein
LPSNQFVDPFFPWFHSENSKEILGESALARK